MRVGPWRRRSSGAGATTPGVRVGHLQMVGLLVLGAIVVTTVLRFCTDQARFGRPLKTPAPPDSESDLFYEASMATVDLRVSMTSATLRRQTTPEAPEALGSSLEPTPGPSVGTSLDLPKEVGMLAPTLYPSALEAPGRPPADSPPPPDAEAQAKLLLETLKARKKEMDKKAAKRLRGKQGLEGLAIINATQAAPFGEQGRLDNPLCAPFRIREPRTVALVGNGPVTEPQRHEIEACDFVIRFNLMNNWRRFLERVDLWVIRYSSEASQHYWGLNNLTPAEALGVFRNTKGVWLVGGSVEKAKSVAIKYPELGEHELVLLLTDPIFEIYQKEFNEPKSYPSTGFIGILGVIYCTPPTTTLHTFGMNWSDRTWAGHKVTKERAYVKELEAQGKVVVHGTPCNAMRECGHKDLDQSCHWASDGRYMCLRGHPRKWKDLTHLLASGRKEDFFTIGSNTTLPQNGSNTSSASTPLNVLELPKSGVSK